jgi:surface protein
MTFPNPPAINNPIPNNPFNYPETPATFDRLFGTLVPNIQLDPNPDEDGRWVRPADWLTMPSVTSTDQKFAGLFAIYDLPENFIALYFEGDYEVDWGDGNVENVTSGEKAQHFYTWSDIPSSTLTTEGYRQVVVTVVPQAGNDLTVMDLGAEHDEAISAYSTNWLDIIVSMPNANSGQSLSFTAYTSSRFHSDSFPLILQRVKVVNSGQMDRFDYAFYFESNNLLRVVELLSPLPPNTSLYSLCSFANSLTDVSFFDTSNVVRTDEMFIGCVSLTSVPLFDTSSVTNMAYMFQYCSSLPTVPLFNTENVTTMANMFQECFSLRSLPPFNTSSVTNFGYTFDGCYNLQKCAFEGTSSTISYSRLLLSNNAIVDIFKGLSNSSSTIYLGMNYGNKSLTPADIAIATDKGWTVNF